VTFPICRTTSTFIKEFIKYAKQHHGSINSMGYLIFHYITIIFLLSDYLFVKCIVYDKVAELERLLRAPKIPIKFKV
jgi:hypothetical protein